MAAIFALVAAFSILIIVGLPNRADYSGEYIDGTYVAPEIGAVAPEINQITLSGKMLNLSSLRGQTVLINFWATWCAPCQTEMPELQALHEDTGVTILGVNIGESEQAIEAWVEHFGLTFDIVPDPDGIIYNLYRVRGQPSTYIISPDGIISYIYYGAVSSDTLLNALHETQNNG